MGEAVVVHVVDGAEELSGDVFYCGLCKGVEVAAEVVL